MKKQATPQKLSSQVWLFDGKPEFVDVNVSPSSPLAGGYVVVFILENGDARIAATRQPGRYVASWRSNVRRYGIPDAVRVLISHPHLRYEAIKRAIASMLSEYKASDFDAFRVDVDVIKEKANEVFSEIRS